MRKFLFKHQQLALSDLSQLPPLDIPPSNNKDALVEYLGPPDFPNYEDKELKEALPGVANVLSVRGFLGVVTKVECEFDNFSNVTEKKSQLTYTGNLETVMSESVLVSKINAHRFLSEKQFKDHILSNVHFHFLDAAVKKDGPSAGITITTAYLSLLLNKPIPADLGMTGEISLNGSVGKIGGLHAKLAAAKANKLKTIFMPFANMNDAFELPLALKKGMELYFVREYSEIYDFIFEGKRNHIGNKIIDGEVFTAIEDVQIHENQNSLEISANN